MSKFLRNLLVQIFKVCQKSKYQIKFERILSSHSRFPAQPRPTSLPPPSSLAYPTASPSLTGWPALSAAWLCLLPSKARPSAAAATTHTRCHRPDDPSSPRNGTALSPVFTPQSPLCFPSPLNRTAGIDAATIGHPIPFPVRPPRSSSDPIKG
jgi:hypothetical protein